MADYIVYFNARQYPALQTMDEFIANNHVRFNVGADATSDMYYRGSDGWLKRIPIGADGSVIGVVGGVPGFVTPPTPIPPTLAQFQVGVGDAANLLSGSNNLIFNGGNFDLNGVGGTSIRHRVGGAYIFGYEYTGSLHAIFSYTADGGAGRYIYSMSNAGVFTINPDTSQSDSNITFNLQKGRARLPGLIIGITTLTSNSILFINSIDQQCYLIYNYTAFELWTENVLRMTVEGPTTTLYNKLNLQSIVNDNVPTNFLVRDAAGEVKYRNLVSFTTNFIQNQNAAAQSANFWISGGGTAGQFNSNFHVSALGNQYIRMGRASDTYFNFHFGGLTRNININVAAGATVAMVQALGEGGSWWDRFIISAFNNAGSFQPTLEFAAGSAWLSIYFPATGNFKIGDGVVPVDNAADRLQVAGTIQADALKSGGAPPTMTGTTMMAISDTTGRIGFADMPTGGATLDGLYRFNTTLTAADPLTGKFRLNTATYSTATEIYISQTSDQSKDLGNVFGTIKSGDVIYLQDKNDATKWMRARVVGLPVDHGTWWTIYIAHINSGGALFINSQPVGVILSLNAFETGGPISVIDVQTTDAANVTTVDTDLMGYIVPGNRLLNDLDHLEITAMFLLAFNSNAKTIKFRFGGATYDITPFDVTTDNGLWVRVEVIRLTATTQKITLYAHPKGGIMHAVTVNGFETLGTAVNMRFVGTGVASGDIIQKSMITKYFPH